MKHFVLPKDSREGVFFCLRGKDFHYVHRVRRLQQGHTLACLGPEGDRLVCRVARIESTCLYLEVIDQPVASGTDPAAQEQVPEETVVRQEGEVFPLPRLHLIQAMPKGSKTDLILRMAVELGIQSFTLVKTARSISDQRENWPGKRQRLAAIAREAAQQAGTTPPDLLDPIVVSQIPELIGQPGDDRAAFVLHEQAMGSSPFHRHLGSHIKSVHVLIGPEGGWTPEELSVFIKQGIIPAYLGPGVLRTEHAGVAALSVIRVLMGEGKSWKLL